MSSENNVHRQNLGVFFSAKAPQDQHTCSMCVCLPTSCGTHPRFLDRHFAMPTWQHGQLFSQKDHNLWVVKSRQPLSFRDPILKFYFSLSHFWPFVKKVLKFQFVSYYTLDIQIPTEQIFWPQKHSQKHSEEVFGCLGTIHGSGSKNPLDRPAVIRTSGTRGLRKGAWSRGFQGAKWYDMIWNVYMSLCIDQRSHGKAERSGIETARPAIVFTLGFNLTLSTLGTGWHEFQISWINNRKS